MNALAAIITREGKIRATNLTFIFWDLFYPLGYLLVFGVGINASLGFSTGNPGLSYSAFFHAGEKERAVAQARIAGGKSQRRIDADAEDQQVPERVEQVPEDERQVRCAYLAFARDDRRQCVHDAAPPAPDLTRSGLPRIPAGPDKDRPTANSRQTLRGRA